MSDRSGGAVRRPPRADQSDPRFRNLPFSDGRPRRFLLRAPTAEAATWTEHFLACHGHGLHRMGAAIGAHGPNGSRWAFAFQIGDGPVPAWVDRLADLRHAGGAVLDVPSPAARPPHTLIARLRRRLTRAIRRCPMPANGR